MAAFIPIIVVAAVFEIFCIFDLIRSPSVRYLPKWTWAIICLCCNPLGGILYLVLGRQS